jgi:ribonuclease J
MASRLCLTPLTGIGQVGGSTWLVECGHRSFLFDFGLDLSRSQDYLGPRLRTRDTRGLQDPLKLGLLPYFRGLYREDLLLNPRDLKGADELDAASVFLSHFHADHAAMLSYLDPDIAVHSSIFTAAFARAHTISSTGLAAEATHLTERVPHPTEIGILHKPRGVDAMPRDWLTSEAPSERMRQFWKLHGSDLGLKQSDMLIAGTPYFAHPVDHSLFGTVALELTDYGVVFATDLRFHGRLGHKTEELVCRLERIRPEVLLLEGTRLGRENDIRTTERQAKTRIRALVAEAGSRLCIAIVSQSNLERLEAFASAAQDSGRKLVVSAKVKLMIESAQSASPKMDLGLGDVFVYDPPISSRPSWHKQLRDRHANSLVSPEQLRNDGGSYILATNTKRLVEWTDLHPNQALLIYSSSSAYSSEAAGEQSALKLWTEMYKMRLEGLTPNGCGFDVDPYLSPSGHLAAEDIRRMIDRVRPNRLVAAHTNMPELFREVMPQGSGVKLILPEIGKTVRV